MLALIKKYVQRYNQGGFGTLSYEVTGPATIYDPFNQLPEPSGGNLMCMDEKVYEVKAYKCL